MSRRTLIAAGILAAQLLLIVVLLWPRGATAAPGPLLASLDPAQVTEIKLESDGDTRLLAKTDGQWVLPDAGNFPVNEIGVTGLLTKVAGIDTSRLVAATPSSHDRLKVAANDYVRKITLTAGDGSTHTLYMGKSPNSRATHVRLDGSNNVYLTPSLSTNDVRMDAGGWINPTYVEAPAERQRRLTVANAQGEVTLVKGADGQWAAEGMQPGESLNTANAATLSQRLQSLSMVAPLGKEAAVEYGLQSPTATVTIELTPTGVVSGATGAPEVVTLEIGAKRPADNAYVVKSSASDYYVTAASVTLDPFVQYGRSDLITTPVVTDTTGITDTLPITPSFDVAPATPLPTPSQP